MSTFFSILLLIGSVTVIISVLLQEGSEGMGTIGGNAPESPWGSSRGANKDIILKRITVVSAVVFMISALALVAI